MQTTCLGAKLTAFATRRYFTSARSKAALDALDALHAAFQPVHASGKLREVAMHIGKAHLNPAQHSILRGGASLRESDRMKDDGGFLLWKVCGPCNSLVCRDGAGVITLIGGQAFGGDSGFLYTGTYTQQGNALTARVHVKQYVAGIANVMGRNEFDLELAGTLQGNIITATGRIPGTSLHLNGTLTKQAGLPVRA